MGRRALASRPETPREAKIARRCKDCGLAFVAILLSASQAVAGSGVTFDLGLTAEYLTDEQRLEEGATVERSNLQTIVSLFVAGHIADPRFLTFEASIERALSRQEFTDEPDTDVVETYYDAGFRLFSNRAVSFEFGAGRNRTDIDGVAQGALVDGVREYQQYALRARGKNWFKLGLRHREQSFTADDPSTLRDEETAWSELRTSAAGGIANVTLQLLWKENDLFDGLVLQEIGSGRFDLDLNRSGRVYWHTDVIGNKYRSARESEEFSPWTDNILIRNFLRHNYGGQGFWELAADYQMVSFDTEEATTGTYSGRVVAPLSPSLLFEGGAGFLDSELADDSGFTQPTVGVGLRWGQNFGGWWLALNPRVSYIQVKPDDGETESSLGSFVSGTVRRNFKRGSVAVQGEYFNNQLSIPDYGTDDAYRGSSFLSGLERERRRGRFLADYRPSRRVGFSLEADYRYRVRLDRGEEVTEDLARGRLTARLGRFALSATANRVDVLGGDLPTVTDIRQVDLSWTPWYWLVLDALAQEEEREVLDVAGTYSLVEAGIRINYARFSFYARYREQWVEETRVERRRVRRIWVGVRRTFGFRFGETTR